MTDETQDMELDLENDPNMEPDEPIAVSHKEVDIEIAQKILDVMKGIAPERGMLIMSTLMACLVSTLGKRGYEAQLKSNSGEIIDIQLDIRPPQPAPEAE